MANIPDSIYTLDKFLNLERGSFNNDRLAVSACLETGRILAVHVVLCNTEYAQFHALVHYAELQTLCAKHILPSLIATDFNA